MPFSKYIIYYLATCPISLNYEYRKDKKQKPIAIRLLNTFCAFMFIGCAVYIFFAGITLIPSLIFLAAIGGLSGPVIILSGSEGILECLIGILEALVEGIVDVFETIGDIFGSILG